MGCGSSKVREFKEPKETKTTTNGQSSKNSNNNKENVTPKNDVTQTKVETIQQKQQQQPAPITAKSDTSHPAKSDDTPATKKISTKEETVKKLDSVVEVTQENSAEPEVKNIEKEEEQQQIPNVSRNQVDEKPADDEKLFKKPRLPILGGTLETRQNEIDSKLSRIYSPTKLETAGDKLTILHFNDVYNIESRDQEPVGGAARFVTKINSFPNEPLVLFSGDCLNPSLSKFFVC